MAQEKKYIIELTETQLQLIGDCVEDCHRFAAGQTELCNTVVRIKNSDRERYQELGERLRRVQPLVAPYLMYGDSYGWDGRDCPDENQRRFIAQTYPIYHQIRHFFAIQQKDNNWSTYRSETRTCEEGGTPIKIKVKEE